MKIKTLTQIMTAYKITWDNTHAIRHEIIYLNKRQKSALKRSKKWKNIINLDPISETTIITKIKIW